MKIHYLISVSVLMSAFACAPAFADTDLAGKWVGQFNAVQIEIPPEHGPIGYLHEENSGTRGPRFAEKTLEIDFESQKNDLMIGTWSTAQFKKQFVCGRVSQAMWNCLDASGHASIDVSSPTAIKVCYFNNLEGALGAGCATMRKTK